jgi:hypothetical protein
MEVIAPGCHGARDILSAVRERGNQNLDLLQRQNIFSHPSANHKGRALRFPGLAGLSFCGLPVENDHRS